MEPAKQSLFSRQIKELEEFFGTELIRRKGRGIALTEAGARLNAIARECFAALSDFKSDCKGQPIELAIGAGDSLIQWLLLPRLEKLKAKLPNVRLKFLNLPTSEIASRLADGTIDLGLLRKNAVTRPLQSTSLGVMGYSLFLPSALRSQRNAGKCGVELLGRLPLATLEGEGRFRSELAAVAKSHGVRLAAEVECSSFPLVARALQTGKVAAILPNIAGAELKASGAVEMPLEVLSRFDREMCVAWHPRIARIRTVIERASKILATELRW